MATKLCIGQDLFNLFYPVGSYYETSNTSWTPQSAGWYGTWEEDTGGKFLVALDTQQTEFNSVGKTGGRKYSGYCDNNWKIDASSFAAQQIFINYSNYETPYSGDQTNLPPYKVVRRWHRTA